MPSVEDIILQRIDAFQESYPYLFFEYDIQETGLGERGLITIMDEEGAPIGYEFVESETTWSDPDVIDELNDSAENDNYTAVIVPTEVLGNMREILYDQGGQNIFLLSYDSLKTILEKSF